MVMMTILTIYFGILTYLIVQFFKENLTFCEFDRYLPIPKHAR